MNARKQRTKSPTIFYRMTWRRPHSSWVNPLSDVNRASLEGTCREQRRAGTDASSRNNRWCLGCLRPVTNNSLSVYLWSQWHPPVFEILDRNMFMSLINAFLILPESVEISYFVKVL